MNLELIDCRLRNAHGRPLSGQPWAHCSSIRRPPAVIRYSAAFSLIELMVVLTLITIMSAVIIPEMRGTYEDVLLRQTARQLIDTFHTAYNLAVTLNQSQHVRLAEHRLLIEPAVHDSSAPSAPSPDNREKTADLDRRISVQLRRSQDAVDEDQAPAPELPREQLQDSNAVTFYSDGTADHAEVLLEDREGFRLALRINPVTSRVKIIELPRREKLQ